MRNLLLIVLGIWVLVPASVLLSGNIENASAVEYAVLRWGCGPLLALLGAALIASGWWWDR